MHKPFMIYITLLLWIAVEMFKLKCTVTLYVANFTRLNTHTNLHVGIQ